MLRSLRDQKMWLVSPWTLGRDLVVAVLTNSLSRSGDPIIEKMNAATFRRLRGD